MAKAPTTKTPEGAGTEYESEASGSANTNGKASATAAGGDPVTSPVIGNPGESRPDMAYDYGLAGANPRAASVPLTAAYSVPKVAPGSVEDKTEYALNVRARSKGHYDGVKEIGEVFENDRNLPTYPEDPTSWIEDASREPDWEVKEKAEKRTRR